MVKVLTPEEALKAFLSKGNAREVQSGSGRSFNPILRLFNQKGDKFYVQGILLKRREIPNPYDTTKIQPIYELKVTQSDAEAAKREKKGEEFKTIPVTPGLCVDIWASMTLDLQLKGVTPGNEVFIQYLGKAAKAEKGRQRAHLFKVVEVPLSAESSEEPTIAEEE